MNFEKIIQVLIEHWDSVVSDLSGKLHEPYYEDSNHPEIPYYVFDWHAESGIPHYTNIRDEVDQCVCEGLIKHSSGTQDPGLPFDTFAQTIEFRLTAPESHRSDVQEIFTEFAKSLKTNTLEIDGTPVVLKADSLPSFSDEFTATLNKHEGVSCFRCEWKVLAVYFTNARLANDFRFHIAIADRDGDIRVSGYVPITKMTVADEIELTADSSAKMNITFEQNTRQEGVQIESLLLDDDMCQAIKEDIMFGKHFGCFYIATIMDGDSVISTQTWVRKGGSIVFAYGSFIAFSVNFVLG